MKTKVEFLNFLRGFDTLESDVIDVQRQEQLALRLAALSPAMRRQLLRKIRQEVFMGRFKLPRR